MIGTLINHVGAVRVTREELKDIEPPPATRTWRPVGHAELIDTLEAELRHRSLAIRDEAFAIQRDGALLFGVIDLYWMQTEEFAAAIGLRTANDKSMSLQMAVGVKVMVCDNLVFSGDLIALRRKHTAGLDLVAEIGRAMDRYQEGVIHLAQDIDRLKSSLITDEEAKLMIFEAFNQGIMPVRFFRPVTDGYFAQPEDDVVSAPRTFWTLHNAFTTQVHQLAPAPAFQATSRLGQLFGLSRHRSLPSVN